MNPFSIIALFLIIGLVVFIHEFGHFLLAKKNGVGVIEFSIGMGPRLLSTVHKGTRYSLKWIPFGGSCLMLGDDNGIVDPDAEEITDKAHSLAEKNVWARISIIAAGPIFNFLLAFVLAVIVIGFAGSDKPYVQGVIDKYPAQEAGLEKGDLITSVNGSRVHLFREIQIYMAMNPGKSLDVTYVRDNQTHETTLVPKYDEANNTYYMGIYSGARYGLKWYETLQYGLYEVKYNVVTVIKSLGMIFTGDLPMTSFSGPVGIATTVNDMVEEVNTSMADESFSDRAMTMFLTLANFVVMISANLGVMNLLPIPALDGGRLLFLLIEAVRGKPVPKEKEAIVHIAGIIFLFIFMIFISSCGSTSTKGRLTLLVLYRPISRRAVLHAL